MVAVSSYRVAVAVLFRVARPVRNEGPVVRSRGGGINWSRVGSFWSTVANGRRVLEVGVYLSGHSATPRGWESYVADK